MNTFVTLLCAAGVLYIVVTVAFLARVFWTTTFGTNGRPRRNRGAR